LGPILEPIQDRKREHVSLSTGAGVDSSLEPGWDDVHLVPAGLPAADMADISLKTTFLGRELGAPIAISALTGGYPQAAEINAALGRLAGEFGLLLELGSQRAMLDHPALTDTYRVARDAAPKGKAFIAANIGISHLVPQPGRPALEPAQLQELIDAVRADAIVVHLNYLQEALQKNGDTAVHGALEAIGECAAALAVPLIVKETGSGLPPDLARDLAAAGVAALDTGGAGGTSMARLEARRAEIAGDADRARLGDAFAGWGLPSAVSLVAARSSGLPLIAGGGIRNGLDAAKALALGATLTGLARPWLSALKAGGEDAARAYLTGILAELRLAIYLSGALSPADLQSRRPVITGQLRQWLEEIFPASRQK
jgi:isopentenyl-diphosphate Delta-isomerase